MRDHLGADVAGGARTIVDDELLPEPLRRRLRNEARDDVWRQTRRITGDNMYRPCRIIERRRTAGRERQCGGACGQL